MIAPRIHLNGSSKDSLLRGYVLAAEAVRKAMDAIAQAAPHGRDYYMQGPAAYAMARHDHEARLRDLNRIRDELESLCFAIDQQESR